MFSEVKTLFISIFKWIAIILILAGFYFFFGMKTVSIYGRMFELPLPSQNSFAVQVFTMMKNDFIPPGVKLLVTNPFSAFLIEMKISIMLAFIFSLPLLLWGILRYLTPALRNREAQAIYKVVVPSTLLFLSGCIFAYTFVIPSTVRVLYLYATSINATPFFDVDQFMGVTFSLMITIGVTFLLPVFMVLSSHFGIIKPDFWTRKWRHALFAILVFGALVTPDGSGITMLMLSLPLFGLYLIGVVLSLRYRHR